MRLGILVVLASIFLTVARASQDDPGKKDMEIMQGDWYAAEYYRDGLKVDDDDAQAIFRTIKGDQYTVFRFEQQIGKGTFKVDATKKPKTIDIFPANAKGKSALGIYEIESDNRYKVCFSAPGKERPSDYTTKEEDGRVMTVWERDSKK